jgi:4,5-DOPA dioxygenase extradiol
MNRLPSLFVSHGAPTFAIEPGIAGPRLTALGHALPRPRAVLVVSPHWMTPSPRVGLVSRPQTMHDFGGFDPALYEIAYPVDGHPELAQRALALLADAGWAPQPDDRRGLDHGAWVPLRYLYRRPTCPPSRCRCPRGWTAIPLGPSVRRWRLWPTKAC